MNPFFAAVLISTSAGTPAASGTPIPAATLQMSTPTPAPEPTTAPRAQGLGSPVLFRGACELRAGCNIIAAGIVTEAGLQPIACDDSNDAEVRGKIAARYFAPGTQLDLYSRGAAVGSFEISGETQGGHCAIRADGHKRNVPSTVMNFVALLPEDPVKLAALKFPGEAQADVKDLVRMALKEAGVTATSVDLDVVRRFREAGLSMAAIDADAGGKHVVIIAEGPGTDSSKWKIAWSSVQPQGEARLTLVDALDLGADGHAKILLEKPKSEGGAEWTLLRRNGGSWKQ